MYHIYEKSLLACVIPSITTAALFGNLIQWLLSLGLLIIFYFVAIGCGLTDQLRILKHAKPDPWIGDRWIAACFCVTLL